MNYLKTNYLNETTIYKLQTIEEGWLDAVRKQLKEDAKSIQAKRKGVYYTFKNGKIFFFFDTKAMGISDTISVWFSNLKNKILRFLTGTKLDEKDKKEIENFQIKKGADVHDVTQVIKLYSAKKDLDAIRYNKLCNTWSYLILPFVKGSISEKFAREIIEQLNGVALPEDVLKDPKVLDNKTEIHCK